MIEISKQSLAAVGKRELSNLMHGEYKINKQMLEADMRIVKSCTAEDEWLKKAKWTLDKLIKVSTLTGKTSIKLAYNDVDGYFDISGIELTCNDEEDIQDETPDSIKKMSRCSIQYLLDDKHTIYTVDYREVLDVIAFEYAINNFELDVHAINIWLKDSNMYGTNDIKDVTRMLHEELGVTRFGELFDEVKQFRIDSMCPRLTVTGDCVNTFIGNKRIEVRNKDKRKDRKYTTVLRRSADELFISVIGELAKSPLADKIKVVAISELGKIAFYTDKSVSKQRLEEETTAVIRLLNKRYKTVPIIREIK